MTAKSAPSLSIATPYRAHLWGRQGAVETPIIGPVKQLNETWGDSHFYAILAKLRKRGLCNFKQNERKNSCKACPDSHCKTIQGACRFGGNKAPDATNPK
ncbi:hypothetical protein TNCV_2017451 [Trichonephila clavipes]|nr:hypothetical protein TNCV_2017451 [Trichonephila clavipes]